LIKFYNAVYISQMKVFLFSLLQNQSEVKAPTPMIKKPIIPGLNLESPLRDSLPIHLMQIKSVSTHNKKKSPMLKYGMTPQTNVLYAFAESPSSRSVEPTNTLTSKRQLTFEDASVENDMLRKGKYSMGMMDKIIEKEEHDNDSNKKNTLKKTSPRQNEGGIGRMLKFDDIGGHATSKTTTTTTAINFSGMQFGNNKNSYGVSNYKGVKLNMDQEQGSSPQYYGSKTEGDIIRK